MSPAIWQVIISYGAELRLGSIPRVCFELEDLDYELGCSFSKGFINDTFSNSILLVFFSARSSVLCAYLQALYFRERLLGRRR